MKKRYSIPLLLLMAASGVCATAAPRNAVHRGPAKIVNQKPVVLPATDITEDSFTANWKAMAGAAGYCMFVYEPVTITAEVDYAIVDESFNLVSFGSTVEPVWDEAPVTYISKDYDLTFTPDWICMAACFAKGMVSGVLYSPTMDLVNNGGKFTVAVDLVGDAGTILSVQSTNGDGVVEKKTQTMKVAGDRLVFEFTNGTHETWLKFVDEGIEGMDPSDAANYLSFFDNITISQHMKPGDVALRPVQVEDYIPAGTTSFRFEDMKYLYGAKELCYDLYACFEYYDDFDDMYPSEVDYSLFSDMEYVTLKTSGVSAVAAEETAPVRYYNLQGVEVKNPRGGVYIRVAGEKSTKVYIK